MMGNQNQAQLGKQFKFAGSIAFQPEIKHTHQKGVQEGALGSEACFKF